ncbi:HAD-like domain-containing protein [Rhexocercosporidium sp. MPI-PUGE-AT-0058]|nr:HAD-like domain-containing protein [Rhexocercosporidium sp. MPI-PUGE-AT-0058]
MKYALATSLNGEDKYPRTLHEPKYTVEKLIYRSLDCSLQVSFPRRKTNEVPKTTPAFVFDIDGVLYDKWCCLPGASRTLKYLQEKNIPFVFLTNRWSETATEGATWIQDTFDLTGIDPTQYISGPSAFATLVPRFTDELVLLVGMDAERTKFVAEYFGFNNVITPDEIYAMYPNHYSGFVPPKCRLPTVGGTQIKAILVFDEPKKPEQDKNLITDLLLSEKGVVGTVSAENGKGCVPNGGYQQDEQPGIWFAVPLAFRKVLRQHWFERTGHHLLNTTTFGKPSDVNFRMAETQLVEWHHKLHGAEAPKIGTIWMIGDNIEADILGANIQNIHAVYSWKSMLVGTGLYRPGMLNGRSRACWPTFFSTGVWEAVQLALRQIYGVHWWQKGGGDWDAGVFDSQS